MFYRKIGRVFNETLLHVHVHAYLCKDMHGLESWDTKTEVRVKKVTTHSSVNIPMLVQYIWENWMTLHTDKAAKCISKEQIIIPSCRWIIFHKAYLESSHNNNVNIFNCLPFVSSQQSFLSGQACLSWPVSTVPILSKQTA